MRLHELGKVKEKSKKRLGRGIGSGRGKTSARGSKGQKARGKIPAGFTGGLALYKKLPLRRGKGNTKVSSKPVSITLSDLSVFKAKSVIDIAELIKAKLISEKEAKKGVKVLGDGELSTALTVRLPVSLAARKKIEEKGGKVDYV